MADDDPSSNKFNAIKSLYADDGSSKDDRKKSGNVPVFKTVTEMEEHLLKFEPAIVSLLTEREQELTEEKGEQNVNPSSSSSDTKSKISSTTPKLKPDLVPTKKPVINTVLTKLRKFEYQGPLAMLCRCVHEKLQIKVWVRGRARIRSILTCYVAAFDKHWNLAVTDVDELYYKKKSINIFRSTRKKTDPNTLLDDVPDCLRYVSVNKELNNREIVRRHVSQLFVKGDNVVMISIVR